MDGSQSPGTMNEVLSDEKTRLWYRRLCGGPVASGTLAKIPDARLVGVATKKERAETLDGQRCPLTSDLKSSCVFRT